MNFNLIRDPWIPVYFKSGKRGFARPAEFAPKAADPIVALDCREKDWPAAVMFFMINLVQTACRLGSISESIDWEPTVEELDAAFGKYAEAFNLFGDGPRFMQCPADVFVKPEKVEKTKPGKAKKEPDPETGEASAEDSVGLSNLFLLRDTADRRGQRTNTVTNSSTAEALGIPAAALCLLAAQINGLGFSGGAYKPGSRGQGTALYLLEKDTATTVWGDILPNCLFADVPGLGSIYPHPFYEDDHGLQHSEKDGLYPPVDGKTFLWLNAEFPEFSGEREATLIDPDCRDYNVFAHLWGMSLYLRLAEPKQNNLCGYFPEQGLQPVVRDVKRSPTPYWIKMPANNHPLSLGKRGLNQKKDIVDMWVSYDSLRTGYHNWYRLLAVTEPSEKVEYFSAGMASLCNLNALGSGYTLTVQGLSKDKASACGFQKGFHLSTKLVNQALSDTNLLLQASDAASKVLEALKGAIKISYNMSPTKDAKQSHAAVGKQAQAEDLFLRETEQAFLAAIDGNSFGDFLNVLCKAAWACFKAFAYDGPLDSEMAQNLAKANGVLAKALASMAPTKGAKKSAKGSK